MKKSNILSKALWRTVISAGLILATALVGKILLEVIVKASTWCLKWLQKGIDSVVEDWTIAVIATVLLFLGSLVFEYFSKNFKKIIEESRNKRAQKKAEKEAKKAKK